MRIKLVNDVGSGEAKDSEVTEDRGPGQLTARHDVFSRRHQVSDDILDRPRWARGYLGIEILRRRHRLSAQRDVGAGSLLDGHRE